MLETKNGLKRLQIILNLNLERRLWEYSTSF